MDTDKLKSIIAMAAENELSGLLIEHAKSTATQETITASYHHGRASAYAEVAAILEGHVQFDTAGTDPANAGGCAST